MSFEIGLIVKPALILAFVGLLALLLRRTSASTLHAIWALGMVGSLAFPLAAVVLPTIDLPVLPEAKATNPLTVQVEHISTLPPGPPVPAASNSAFDRGLETGQFTQRDVPATHQRANQRIHQGEVIPRTWSYWLKLVWALGSCMVLLGWIVALWELRRWKRTSTPIDNVGWTDLLAELRQELSVFLPVELRMSARSVPPMTWGLFRPVILVPAEAAGWNLERRRLVLAHELGHVKRYDSLGQILCQSTCCIYWFNPLVWYAAHRLHVERERACDDIVLRLGAKAADYAENLVQIARGLNAGFSWTVVSMAHPSQLKTRVVAILNPRMRRQQLSRLAACGFVALVMTLTISAAVIQLTTLASMALPTLPAFTTAPPALQPPELAKPAQAVVSESPSAALIEGQVVREDGEAIAGAVLELRSIAGNNPLAIVADERGTFSFKDVPPGDYRLAATAQDHVRSEYGQKRMNGPGVTIQLRAGQAMRNVSLPLVPTGAISGQIRGRSGLPAANVQVHALQYGYEDGRRVLKTVRVMTTNDRGDYRLYWLPPGNYLLMAVPLGGVLDNTILIVGADGTVRGFTGISADPVGKPIALPDENSNIPIYYPGTTRAQDASVLALKAGEDKTGVDVTLMRTQSFRVRGTFTNPPPFVEGNAAGPPTTGSVRLEALSSSPLDRRTAPLGFGSVDTRTGAFEIRGVLPGSYNLLATASTGGRGRTPIFARVPIEVVNRDIDNLRITLAPGFEVSGKITMEGGGELPLLRVMFNQNNAQRIPAQPDVFTARSLQPNHYTIRVDFPPELGFPGYVKAVKVGDLDIRDTGIVLQGPLNTPVEIVISPNGGSVSGSAVTEQRAPAANVPVVLIPSPSLRNRTDLYKVVRSGADGSFRITGITPGEYKLYAWSDVEDGAWRDPEFMKAYEERGDALRVSAGSTATVRVGVLP